MSIQRSVLLVFIGLLLSCTVRADEVKQRMIERRTVIASLIKDGVIGETHDGFLAFRENRKDGKDLVEAENADRRAVYATIAKEQGTTPDFVGRRRAAQIAAKAKPGTWFRDENKTWRRK